MPIRSRTWLDSMILKAVAPWTKNRVISGVRRNGATTKLHVVIILALATFGGRKRTFKSRAISKEEWHMIQSPARDQKIRCPLLKRNFSERSQQPTIHESIWSAREIFPQQSNSLGPRGSIRKLPWDDARSGHKNSFNCWRTKALSNSRS